MPARGRHHHDGMWPTRLLQREDAGARTVTEGLTGDVGMDGSESKTVCGEQYGRVRRTDHEPGEVPDVILSEEAPWPPQMACSLPLLTNGPRYALSSW